MGAPHGVGKPVAGPADERVAKPCGPVEPYEPYGPVEPYGRCALAGPRTSAGDKAALSVPRAGEGGDKGRRVLRLAREGLTELLWPTRCVGCDMPGELLCEDCRDSLPWICQGTACPCCGAPFGSLVCTGCAGDWEPRATICAMGFDGAAARMVVTLKDHHELRLAPVMAAAMATALDEASAWPARDGLPRFDAQATDAVTFVPATAEAYARRGFDHMELVARALAEELGLPLADVLVRAHARDQRGLGRDERAANLGGSMRVTESVSGLRLLLVDDVVTTGASVREGTRTLLAHGAQSVVACAFARVW